MYFGVANSGQNFPDIPAEKLGHWRKKPDPLVIFYFLDIIWIMKDNFSGFKCVKKLKISRTCIR